MKKKLLLFISLLAVVSMVGGCSSIEEKQSRSFYGVFDTIVTITAYEDKESFDKLVEISEDTLLDFSKHFDRYNDYEGINNIKTINDMAGVEPVKVDKKIIDILEYAISNYDLVDGKVNLAFGAVLSIWHEYREEALENNNPSLPDMDLLYEANRHVNIEDIIIDKVNSTVFLKDKDMSLDLGAIAKGYSVERLVEILKKEGYDSFLINAGGNVRTVGRPTSDKDVWVVGIQDPNDEGKIDDIIRGNDVSIVTSGVYQRFYEFQGEKYHHIIDTKTLMPGNNFKSVSIIGEDSGLCDILSTGTFLMEPNEALALIDSIDGIEGIFILNDDTKYYSKNMDKYLEDKNA